MQSNNQGTSFYKRQIYRLIKLVGSRPMAQRKTKIIDYIIFSFYYDSQLSKISNIQNVLYEHFHINKLAYHNINFHNFRYYGKLRSCRLLTKYLLHNINQFIYPIHFKIKFSFYFIHDTFGNSQPFQWYYWLARTFLAFVSFIVLLQQLYCIWQVHRFKCLE